MSLELQVLRTAKAAVQEGLMSDADYDTVKSAFLKALAIKGGVDSGFIGEADFAEARREFFQSLGMGGLGGAAAAPNNNSAPAARALAPVSTPAARPPPAPAATSPVRAAPQAARSAAPDVTPVARSGMTRLDVEKPASPASQGAPTPKSGLGTPSSISSRGGGVAAVSGKKSMSGISVHPDAVNIVWELRVKKAHRWVMFQIAGTGKEVVIEGAGEPGSNWDAFIDVLPENECRYGVFDYQYVNSENVTFGKIVFLSWAPDEAPTKAKMQHASTKDLFRGLLEGVSVEIHATDSHDLAESTVRDRVAATVARK